MGSVQAFVRKKRIIRADDGSPGGHSNLSWFSEKKMHPVGVIDLTT